MSGRRVLVTGAGSGIGAALLRRLIAAGEDAIGTDLRAADGIMPLDLARDGALDERELAALTRYVGPLDGCAHVAGLPGIHAAEHILRVNFLAVRQLTRGLLPQMNSGAAIVVVSSITAHRCPLSEAELFALVENEDSAVLGRAESMSGDEAYALSKALLNVWVAAFAFGELQREDQDNIRANAIAPGPVETPILNDFRSSMGADRIAAAERVTGRHGSPDEIASAAAFLLSPEARWINGAVLDCDGGYGAARRANAHRREVVQ